MHTSTRHRRHMTAVAVDTYPGCAYNLYLGAANSEPSCTRVPGTGMHIHTGRYAYRYAYLPGTGVTETLGMHTIVPVLKYRVPWYWGYMYIVGTGYLGTRVLVDITIVSHRPTRYSIFLLLVLLIILMAYSSTRYPGMHIYAYAYAYFIVALAYPHPPAPPYWIPG